MAKIPSFGSMANSQPAVSSPMQLSENKNGPNRPEFRSAGKVPNLFEQLHIPENPFGVTPNPRYLYQSRSHAEARASLIIGIESGLGFQALIAPPGMGKTTIVFDLLERFNRVARTAFLFQLQGDTRDFLRSLMSELDSEMQVSDLVNIQDAINRLLIKERRTGKRTIIVIDEAQSLSTEVLETVRLLSNFETSTDKLLQIVLAGQPQLAVKLATPGLAQLHQRISILKTLVPFDSEDTKNYIEHRLKIAGYRGQPLFTASAFKFVWETSCGIPREINTICFNALLLLTAIGKQQVDSDILQEVIADLEPAEIAGALQNSPKRKLTKRFTQTTEPEGATSSTSLASDGQVTEYLRYYNLSRNPFEATPDPSFLCCTSTHSAALAALYSAILQHPGVMLLTGAPGTGKSLMAACLLDLLKCGRIQAEYTLGRHLSAFDVSRFAASTPGSVSSGDEREQLRIQSANGLTQGCHQTMQVLLIDEADDLSTDVMRNIHLLVTTQNHQKKPSRILLAGRPELKERIELDEHRSLKELIAIGCHLKPLGAADTQKYIACRLRVAQTRPAARPVFEEDALASVCCHSRGFPRLISRICESALMRGYVLRQGKITAGIIEEIARQPLSTLPLQQRIPTNGGGDPNEVLKAAKVLVEFQLGLHATHSKKGPSAMVS
jgi:type II secretory pathway predicted ATPase ExeA